MAKLDRDELLRQGEKLLESWGVGSTPAIAELRPLLGRELSSDLAIARRLGAIVSEESIEPLRRLEAASAPKLLRKEARRALHRLQQRGLSIPEPVVERPAPVLTGTTEGFLSPVDGNGDQLVWIVKPARGGGLQHLFAVVNDPEGLREVNLAVISRKGLKTLRAELEAKHQLRLVAADWPYCDFLMRRAFRWAAERGNRVEGDFPGLRQRALGNAAAVDLPPLVFAHLGAAEIEAEPAFLARSDELVEEPEFRTWWLQRDRLQSFLDQLVAIKDSPLVLDQTQQDERFRAVVDRAVEEIFLPPLRDSWARRLYEMAYFLWASSRPERAKSAAAAALALGRSERGGRDVPFCEILVRGSIAFFFEELVQKEEAQAKESLVMTPQQLRAMQQRRGR
jgi:hypothetical protein